MGPFFAAAGCAILVVGHLLAGWRLQRWVERRRILIVPRDAGAWCGLALGVAAAIRLVS